MEWLTTEGQQIRSGSFPQEPVPILVWTTDLDDLEVFSEPFREGSSVLTNSRHWLQTMFTSPEKTELSLILVASLWCMDLLLSVCKLLSQFLPGLWQAWRCSSSPRAVVQLTPNSSSLSLTWTNLRSKWIGNTRINYQRICEKGRGSA